MGPNEDHSIPIQNGKIDGTRLTFEVLRNNRLWSFDLKLSEDGLIQGDMRRRDVEQTAKISLKRAEQK